MQKSIIMTSLAFIKLQKGMDCVPLSVLRQINDGAHIYGRSMAVTSDPYQIWKLLSLFYKSPLGFLQDIPQADVDLTFNTWNCRKLLEIAEDDYYYSISDLKNRYQQLQDESSRWEWSLNHREASTMREIQLAIKAVHVKTQLTREIAL